ncbi:hypothetical protein DHD80_06635 [Gramella sp. AN32]|nr:hypothetical protein [Gramella sp. AN32]
MFSCGEKHPKERVIEIDKTEQAEKSPAQFQNGVDKRNDFLQQRIAYFKKIQPVEENKLDTLGNFKLGKQSPADFRKMLELNERVHNLRDLIPALDSLLKTEVEIISLNYQNEPSAFADTILKKIQQKDFKNLNVLCDPWGENDSLSMNICWLEYDLSENKKKWSRHFEKYDISEIPDVDPQIRKFLVVSDPLQNRNIEMQLVKRGDHWYLLNFDY